MNNSITIVFKYNLLIHDVVVVWFDILFPQLEKNNILAIPFSTHSFDEQFKELYIYLSILNKIDLATIPDIIIDRE